MSPQAYREFVVLGGGVLGLSVARELAARGVRVTLIEKDASAPENRAGAATQASLGVLTAPTSGSSPFKRLQALGHRSYPALATELLDETGIDIGYRVTGSLHLKPQMPRSSTRAKVERLYREAGLEAAWVERDELRALAPALRDDAVDGYHAALHVASEAVVHPPDLARALRASCERRGVAIREGVSARLRGGGSVLPLRSTLSDEVDVETANGDVFSGVGVVVAAGSWSRLALASSQLVDLPVRPVRGQAIEVRFRWPRCPNLRFEPPFIRKEYHIVWKAEGLAWIGSTVEDSGFDAQVTKAGVDELVSAARHVLPEISEKDVERAWAGLRPQALRVGGPFLGRLPGSRNAWVACGHYRSGILTGPTSARLLVREIFGEEVSATEAGLDSQSLQAFRVER